MRSSMLLASTALTSEYSTPIERGHIIYNIHIRKKKIGMNKKYVLVEKNSYFEFLPQLQSLASELHKAY